MIKPILQKIYNGDQQQAVDDILTQREQHNHVVVSFLYFANITKRRLCEKAQNQQQDDYKQSLLNADFLLIDGIALQIFRKILLGKSAQRIPNLNGTDFQPFLFQEIKKKYGVCTLILYGASEEVIPQAAHYLEQSLWCTVLFYQDWYRELDRSMIEILVNKNTHQDTIPTFLLVWRGTPKQELRTQQNIQHIKSNKLIVANVWWSFDFRWGVEKRAPQRVVKLRVGETIRRIITNPQKNMKKFIAMFGIIRILAKNIGQFVLKR